MNHHIQPGGAGKVQLLAEYPFLNDLQMGVLLGRSSLGRGHSIKIQAALTESNDLGMTDEIQEVGGDVPGGVQDMSRVPANGGVDGRKAFGDVHRTAACRQVRSDGKNAADSRRLRPVDNPGEILGKIGEIKMGVGIDQHVVGCCQPKADNSSIRSMGARPRARISGESSTWGDR